MELQRSDMKRPAPAPVTLLQSEVDSVNPSNNKRPHLEEPHSAELSTHAIRSGRDFTILDMLDVYCWGLVLDHVPVADVVRSERVSRAWQRVVRDYLPGVRKYLIVHLYKNSLKTPRVPAMSRKKYSIINLTKRELFENMIKKMGPFFVSVCSYIFDKEMMEAMAMHCPNLQQIRVHILVFKPQAKNLKLDLFAQCKKLKQLSLNLTNQGDDSSLKEIITIETLQELIIVNQHVLTGSFLMNLRSNLKTLIFVGCDPLLIENILAVADRLTALTRLELNYNSINTLKDVHLLLDKTPNLEHLCLEYYKKIPGRPWIDLSNELPTAIGRLSQLKELRLWNNDAVTDEWLAILAPYCPALRSINIGRTRVSPSGLRALCRVRPELVELVVCSPFVMDKDLEACASYCRGLELLELSHCYRLTASLPARLARPRPRPLRMRMFAVLREKIEVHHEGIILLYDRPDWCSWPD